MALNDPRTIDFDFKVCELDGWIWLFDNSERTYICSSQAAIWAVPLWESEYSDDDTYPPGPNYWNESQTEFAHAISVPVEIVLDTDEKEAWSMAEDEAHAHRYGEYSFTSPDAIKFAGNYTPYDE